jgi:CubicO group peptidase (beta-lactamase class C family)
MTVRTIFDLASLTKPMATAPLIVEPAVRGEISLLDPLERHLPETGGFPVGSIPLHMLLTHTAGFVPDNPIEDYAGTKAALLQSIAHEPLASDPGTRFDYSDVGYVLLQLVIERRARRRLDRVADETLFQPLGFRDTRFGARATALTRTRADRARPRPLPPRPRARPAREGRAPSPASAVTRACSAPPRRSHASAR